jgi:hypothetical protein
VGIVAVILLIGFVAFKYWSLDRENDKLRVEAQKQSFNQEKIRIEKEYIPAALDKLTTDEKSHMGSVMWGE